MCFEQTEVSSSEHGRITHSKITNEYNAHPDSPQQWRSVSDVGTIQFSEIKDELYSIWHCEYQMKKDTSITLQAPKSGSIGLSFTLKKNIHFYVKDLGTGVSRKNQYNMTYLPDVLCEYKFKKGEYASFGVQFQLDFLEALGIDNSPLLLQFLNNVKSGKATQISTSYQTVSPEMLPLINDLRSFSYKGTMPKLYLRVKVAELLRLSVENIATPRTKAPIDLRPSDIQKIHLVKEHLLKNLYNPGTLSEIAHIVGLNECKLKYGFKYIFGNTVFGFVYAERLNAARVMILESGLPMKSIAQSSGYRNVSNFATAFRKAFGYSPGSLKRKLDKE
jgi:AraC family transcriptional regulator, transcriptional activator of the genes for pyochelin and ferripyochelin receptors